MPAVSVIVPVFDPGSRIGPCVESLLGQTLPPGDVELIFVDDGSTDGTAALLDALAARHPHVRVEHMPNSGWPGRPRNRGLELAGGDYVLFVDDDDWLDPEALERMHRMAVADGADIVIGKVVGHNRTSARRLFERNLHGVAFTDRPLLLLKLLTPHKLFRRELIERHGLRFPEGHRRLEDHAFVIEAYFAAERISVLADHPCYHWVFHGGDANVSQEPIDAGYYADLRQVLDAVERHTEPGPLRDRLLSHWYRGKMLGRLSGPGFLAETPARREALLTAIRELAVERWDDGVHERLPYALRVRSRLMRAGQLDAVTALARFEAGLAARPRLERIDVRAADVVLEISARLAGLRFTARDARIRWEPPAAVAAALDDDERDVTTALARSRVRLHLEAVDGGVEYLVATESRAQPGPEPRVTATATVVPATAAAGSALPAGSWYVRAMVDMAGFTATAEVLRGRRPLVLRTDGAGGISAGAGLPRLRSLRHRAARRWPRLARFTRRMQGRRRGR